MMLWLHRLSIYIYILTLGYLYIMSHYLVCREVNAWLGFEHELWVVCMFIREGLLLPLYKHEFMIGTIS